MASTKPRITDFRWHDKYMAIDWEMMLYAFVIDSQYGGAKILVHSPDLSVSVQGTISAHQIRRFLVRADEETGLAEVVLEVTYGSREECLGLTDKVEEARRWIARANDLIGRVQDEIEADIVRNS